ncbi:MAG TPA: hypothetical protein VFI33_08025 [Puia sp.]|nr:hypothetical protein [Puia sp.]
MARNKENYIIEGTSGRIGQLCVMKIINGKTFVTKYPDRSKVVYSKEQLGLRDVFAQAAKFASEIVNDPVKKRNYPRQGRKSIYHCALSDYLAEQKRNKSENLSVQPEK